MIKNLFCFEEKEIDIEAAGENLTIKGSKDKEASEGLVHQGLAARDFTKTFVFFQTNMFFFGFFDVSTPISRFCRGWKSSISLSF